MSNTRTARGPAALWAMGFALVHLYWALGGRGWLPSDITLTPGSALHTVALIAIPLLIGSGLAVLKGGRRHAACVAVCVCIFCFLHALPALAQFAFKGIQAGSDPFSERDWYGLSYEVNWLLGGAAFLRAHLGLRRGSRAADRRTPD